MIHWPQAFKEGDEIFPTDDKNQVVMSSVDYIETWKEMEKAIDDGLVKSIGISNFNRNQTERILKIARIKPVTNQVECHPYLTQQKLSEYSKNKHITITAYSPLGSPNRPSAKADDPVLLDDQRVR